MQASKNNTYLVQVDIPSADKSFAVCGNLGRFVLGSVRHEKGLGWTVHALAVQDAPYGNEAFGTAEEAAEALYSWYVHAAGPGLEV